MPTLIHNLYSFAHYAARYLRDAQKAEPGHSQPIRARYAREFLNAVGIAYTGPSLEQIQSMGPCIYVSNHTSILDAILVCACFENDLRILEKDSLFKAPYLGRILKLERHIPVARGKNASARNQAIRESIRSAIAEGASVLFFPEGTRTPTGKLGTFKLGAFYNAIQTQTPIVPVVVKGAFEAMPKQTLKIKPGRCSLELLSPIELPDESMGDETERAKYLSQKAFDAIQKALDSE